MHPAPHVSDGDEVEVTFAMERSKENHRLMEVDFSYKTRELSGKVSAPVAAKFYIE